MRWLASPLVVSLDGSINGPGGEFIGPEWLPALPELVGQGTRLFGGPHLRSRLDLLKVARMDTGAILSRHGIARPSATGR